MSISSRELVSEEKIISCLSFSDPFKKFHYEKWNPKKYNTKWLIDPELIPREGHYAMSGEDLYTGAYIITLASLPKSSEDAYLVAHEMGHVIRLANNLSLNIIDKYIDFLNVTSNIRSVLEDRLVDNMLKEEYKFNLLDHYNHALDDAVKRLENIDSGSDAKSIKSYIKRLLPRKLFEILIGSCKTIDQIRLSLTYADYLLRFSLINDDKFQQKFDIFKNTFNKKFPLSAQDGEDIAREAMRIGLDTSDDQKQVFEYIINKYKLSDVISIEDQCS